MSWAAYGAFLGFAALVCITPGPDFAAVTKNAIAGGRAAGAWTAVGVGIASAAQGTIAAFGLGAVIVASRPLFEAIRWAGVVYLCFLAVGALRSAWRARDEPIRHVDPAVPGRPWWVRAVQGLLTNVTNPKVLVFYLAVLPQFLTPDASVLDALALANTLPVIATLWLLATVSVLHLARRWMQRRRVRRSLDALTGLVMFGLAGRLAADSS